MPTVRLASFVCLMGDRHFLLTWSPKHKCFHLLGGKVDETDIHLELGYYSPLEDVMITAAIRELEEETGFAFTRKRFSDSQHIYQLHNYDSDDHYKGLWVESCFVVRLNSEEEQTFMRFAQMEPGHPILRVSYAKLIEAKLVLSSAANRFLFMANSHMLSTVIFHSDDAFLICDKIESALEHEMSKLVRKTNLYIRKFRDLAVEEYYD